MYLLLLILFLITSVEELGRNETRAITRQNTDKKSNMTLRFISYLPPFSLLLLWLRSIYYLHVNKYQTDLLQVGFTIDSPSPKWPFTGGSSSPPVSTLYMVKLKMYCVFLLASRFTSKITYRDFHYNININCVKVADPLFNLLLFYIYLASSYSSLLRDIWKKEGF